MFMFATGARISEALQLSWEDIDLKRKLVLIKQRKIGNERVAHIPASLVIRLANIRGQKKPFPLSPSTYVYHWQKTIEAAGIEVLSFHSCRHGFATGLLRAGIDVMTVAKLGGWKSAQHVFQTYGHANDDPTLTDRLFDVPMSKVKEA